MGIKRIFSAGGIVLKKVSKGPKEPEETKVLLTQHSGHKGWEFPKGHIEVGESSEQAAVREVEEEAGVKAEVLEKAGECQYFYFEDKQRVLKKVTFYLMKYLGEGEATTAFEVSNMVWLSVGEVEAKLTYKGTKEVWRDAKESVERLKTKV